jgi:hypothetical protein
MSSEGISGSYISSVGVGWRDWEWKSPEGPKEQLHLLIGSPRHQDPSRLGMRDGHSGPAKVRANFEDSPALPPAGR